MTASITNPHFLLRRLHSLFGLIPIGGFLIFHLWENSQSRFGAEYFNQHVVKAIEGMNYVLFLEIFAIALPILFHAAYGIVIWKDGKTDLARYKYAKNWMWWLQRISGLAIVAFLIYHVGWTRILGIFDDGVRSNMFGHMQGMLSNPLAFGAYVVGLTLAVFHLSNGLWTFCLTWGITTTPRAMLISRAVTVALGLLLLAFGIHSLSGFLFETPVPHPLIP